MPPSDLMGRCGGAFLLLLAVAPLSASLAAATADDLDALRRECIAAARETQQREQAVAELRHQMALLGRDADARRRGLDDSRREQARLLGVIEFLSRNPPDRGPLAAPPLDRLRGEVLIAAAIPALRTQARALAGEIGRVAALKRQIAATQEEFEAAEKTLTANRDRLAELAGRRHDFARELLPTNAAAAARVARLGREAKDFDDLLRRAETASERRDKELVVRARAGLPKEAAALVTADNADPTRPAGLRAFEPPQSALITPVSGPTERTRSEPPPDAADPGGAAKAGLDLPAPEGGEVVAPFDGRLVFAGAFRDFGLVLIIRHGHGYHSLLAGLGRVDIGPDQWVLAGEPVGAMPDAANRPLYFELRRDGRPVDPQPWLARSDDRQSGEASGEPDERNGDQRMRQ